MAETQKECQARLLHERFRDCAEKVPLEQDYSRQDNSGCRNIYRPHVLSVLKICLAGRMQYPGENRHYGGWISA